MSDAEAGRTGGGFDPVPDCPAPRETVRASRLRVPPGACDCHLHVFGPYDRFPLAPARAYTPPAAPLAAYRRVERALGLDRCVLVQPSVYGDDHRCLLDALGRLGPARARAVAVVRPERATPAHVRGLDAAGVRGVRCNAVAGGGPALDALDALARSVAPIGWHLQVYLPAGALPALAPALGSLPVPVVIDHDGGIDPRRGLDDPAFVALRRLLDGGRASVKLTGYRVTADPAPFAALASFRSVLARDHGDRLLWGTDWPHPVRAEAMPDDGDLLDAVATGLGDDTGPGSALRRILVDNPARLYGFAPNGG